MPTITSKRCPRCKSTKQLEVSFAQLLQYERGAQIQDAFPHLSADDRERFITGYCPKCWNSIFHNVDASGEYCSCEQDAVTCQECGKRVCGTLVTWVDGKGNVCNDH